MVCKDWEKGKKIFLIICAIIVVIMVILGIVAIELKPEEITELPLTQNQSESEFSGPSYTPSKVYDAQQTEFTLSDLADKPMALIFFNTTNSESLEALKIFAEQEETYSDKVNIVAICVMDGASETPEAVKETLANDGIILKNILFDLDYSAKNEYNINKIPTFVFVNKNKEIINTLEINIDEDIITANLDILAENY